MTRAWVLLIGLAALAGCAATIPPAIVSRPVTLPIPQRPVLAPVSASAVQCLSDAAYTALVNRERALRTWALELLGVIEANNAAAKKSPFNSPFPAAPAKGKEAVGDGHG